MGCLCTCLQLISPLIYTRSLLLVYSGTSLQHISFHSIAELIFFCMKIIPISSKHALNFSNLLTTASLDPTSSSKKCPIFLCSFWQNFSKSNLYSIYIRGSIIVFTIISIPLLFSLKLTLIWLFPLPFYRNCPCQSHQWPPRWWIQLVLFFFFLSNSFLEIQFTCHKINILKVWNSGNFSVFTELYNHHCYQF